jgi:hypothetical protein
MTFSKTDFFPLLPKVKDLTVFKQCAVKERTDMDRALRAVIMERLAYLWSR